ncbi:uncharacterized protein LOC141685344 [Apium graveolens]|uniref:uncharacterized protein LOC141685344 n=1 Tax=Apium graveolens TaxID=4045 RepID=UPI003D7A8444
MVEQVARRRLNEGSSSSDADVEAQRVHKIIRWMLTVLEEILDEFIGLPDLIKAQSWLREIEKVFELAEVKDDKKAQYTSYYLKDEASYWWESSKALLEGKVITWEKFTEMFLEKYFPIYMQDQLEMKFLNLRQEDMTVAEYEVKFLELARFAPEYVNTEVNKAKRFQQGLKPGIRSQVALFEIRNYAALVQKAMIVEGEIEATKRESEGNKRKFEESEHDQGSSKFGGKFGKNARNQNQKLQKFKPGNGNQKNCFQKTGQLVNDNRPHMLRIDGPPPPSAPAAHPRARTFNITMKDAVQNADVVACTLVINSVEVKVLMESGATRSFIAESVIDKLKCIVYPLKPNLIIEVANQERVTVNKGCEAYLAHVKDIEAKSLRIEDISVVKDFTDVFPDELPGLPPDREIEFIIDLAPGTEPVWKAPYRMAPVEMKELAMQLKELLNKGVIHPSVSMWGASVLFVKKKYIKG